MMAVLAVGFLAAGTVNAGYVVYKTKNMPNAYAAGTTKAVKSTIETYTIIQTGAAGFVTTEAPYRIIIFKDKAVGKGSFYIAESGGTVVPADVKAKYAPYWGSWTTASVANLGTTFRAIFDINGETGQGVAIPAGSGELYVGSVKDGLAKKLAGALVYNTLTDLLPPTTGAVTIDTKGAFTWDKKASEAVADSTSMADAVADMEAYLLLKKYSPATFALP